MAERATPDRSTRLSFLNRRGVQGGDLPDNRHHSTRVRYLRRVLPILAFGLLGIVMAWPTLQENWQAPKAVESGLSAETLAQAATENRVLNARYSSLDNEGRPYTLVAAEAVQEKENPDSLFLEAPEGVFDTGEGAQLTVKAKRGLYEQAQAHLSLIDAVDIRYSDGTRLTTTLLHLSLNSQDAKTQAPVRITGPRGTLDAAGLVTAERGMRLVFTGPARLVLPSKEPTP